MKSNKKIFITLFVSMTATLLSAEVLTFSRAYELALENSNQLKSSIYMSESDKERINQEKSQLYPQLNLSGYYKKSEQITNPSSNRVDQGLFNYGVSLQQSIYNHEIYSKIDAQQARSKYSLTGVEMQKEELAKNIFTIYIDVLKSKNKINLLEAYLAYNTSKLEELTKKYELKLANKMDLLEMQVEYNSAQIELSKEKKLFKVYDLKLKQMIGDEEYELPIIDSSNKMANIINLMRESLDNSKEPLRVKQAQIGIEISKGDMDTAQSGHYPRVNLNASYAMFDTDTPTIDAPYESVKYVMLTLDIPIYSGGYVSSKVLESQLKLQAANEDLINAQKEIKVQYDEYMALFESSSESVAMYNNAFESAELYVDAIEQGYSHGLKSIIDVNDAKNKFYEVKYKYIENMYELVDSYIGLLMLTNNFENIDLLDKLVE